MSEASDTIRKLRAEKRPDEAIAQGEALLAGNPGDCELAAAVAEAYADKGEFRKAESIISGAIKRDPHNKTYYLKRSVFRFKLDDRNGALEDANAAYAIDPNDQNAVKALVDITASLGDYKKALEWVGKLEQVASKIDPSVPERKRNLLKLIRATEESDTYNMLVDGARENAKEDNLLAAKRLIEMCSEKRGAEYYEVACNIYRKLGMAQEAVREAEEAGKRKLANTKIMRAHAFSLMDLQRNDEAVKVLDRAIALDSEDAGLYADRAVAKMNSGDWPGALRDIDTAIKINPHRDVFYIRKGDIVARLEGAEKALPWYERAIQENPLNIEARERKESAETILYRKAGKEDKTLFR
ncbi:MAG: tetratricopeptide repeat protein [Candidatus Micrarchaeota archaeon]|nr:tetratricopeptide repeat protein [Candidatus Micrarchaeota archaeon]